MHSDWDKLKVSQAELEKVFEPNIFFIWAIAITNALILRQPKSWQSILSIESSCLFISLLILFPIVLITCRNLSWVDNNTQGLIIVLIVAVSLSGLLLMKFNYYLWQKAKQLKLLSSLLIKVNRHNKIISSFQLLTNINRMTNTKAVSNEQSIVQLQTAFNLTKTSLLNSIELENFIYSHRQGTYSEVFPHNPARLIADLENNLANISFPEIDRDREYQQVLNEAVDLGLSVHQEIKKIWTLRQSD